MRPRKQNDQSLTKSETAILILLWDGLSSEEVAAHQGCAKRTVDFHVANIFAKLKVTNRVQMIRAALAKGIIS